MFSDTIWTAEDIATYAALMGVPTDAVAPTQRFLRAGRIDYFGAIEAGDEDVFSASVGMIFVTRNAARAEPVEYFPRRLALHSRE